MLDLLNEVDRTQRQIDRWLKGTDDKPQQNLTDGPWQDYIDDPVGFAVRILRADPAPYQEEALIRLRDNRRASLRGPHGLGKTALSSWAILWFGTTRPIDTKIPTTASAWRQLEKFLWPEIKKWHREADWQAWAEMGGAVPEMFTLKMQIGAGCEAFALASDRAELIEGAHGTNLLYLFDESKAIPDATWDAAEGAFASGDAYWLAVSTPGDRSGRFYDIHRHAPGLEDWWARHVTLEEAIDAGRIRPEWADDRRKQWGEDSPVYQARVLGEFPDQSDDTLISLRWIEAARGRTHLIATGEKRTGVDIARHGNDDSALFLRKGNIVMDADFWHGNDTMESVGRVKRYIMDHGVDFSSIDEIGVGAGVVDRLQEQKMSVAGVNVGEGATDKEHFRNLRAELYWNLRERFREGQISLSRLPSDVYERLSGELTSIRFKYTSKGQIQIESKDEMKKRLGRSPDFADALMLAFAPRPSLFIEI